MSENALASAAIGAPGAPDPTRPPPPAITADLIARAIIAAAGVYRDDPVRVLTARRGLPKRSLPAAIAGLRAAGHADLAQLRRILGCRRDVIARATARGVTDPDFRRAVRAAEGAARYAAWRPDARASVVGGHGGDQVEAAGVVLPPPAVSARSTPALTAKTAFQPKPRAPKAPAAVSARPAARPVAEVSYADAVHLQHIRNANGGRGFPAPVKA